MPEKFRRPHNHERRQTVEQMKAGGQAQRDALATVRHLNAKLSAKRAIWFWPKIAAAVVAKHPWLIIACDSCRTVVDLDLRVNARSRGINPSGAARRTLPVLQWSRPAADNGVGYATFALSGGS